MNDLLEVDEYWRDFNEKIKEENEIRWSVIFSEIKAMKRKEKIRRIYRNTYGEYYWKMSVVRW